MAFEITFSGSSPLSRPMSSAFLGWASQTQFEAFHLLQNRDAEWLNGVAEQIRSVLAPTPGGEENWQPLLLAANPSRTAGIPFPFLVSEPGQLGLFAAREPHHTWQGSKPKTEQWERYAVFAALSIMQALKLADAAEENRARAARLLHEAGGLAIEAVRALQIAHSLHAASSDRKSKASTAASARHAGREQLLARAKEIALSRPFQSKKAAAAEVIDRLTEEDGVREYDLDTVLGWFREMKIQIEKAPRPTPIRRLNR